MFHHDRHELHGITVVVDTDGDEVYIGRCDNMTDIDVILNDVSDHRDGEDGITKADFIRNSAKFGVERKHPRLVIPAARVVSVTRLGDVSVN